MPALVCLSRRIAENRDRKDPALQAARTVAQLRTWPKNQVDPKRLINLAPGIALLDPKPALRATKANYRSGWEADSSHRISARAKRLLLHCRQPRRENS